MIATSEFRGERWLADKHKLGSEYAAEANNMWPRATGLTPLRFGLKVQGIEAENADWSFIRSAYKFNNRLIGSTVDNVDFVEHPVNEIYDRLYFVDPGSNPNDTNQGLIKFYDGDSIPPGQVLDMSNAHRLGVLPPSFRADGQDYAIYKNPGIGVPFDGADWDSARGANTRDVFITHLVHTHVNKWGEESDPSPPSPDLKYFRSRSNINYTFQSNLTGDSNIIGFRVYMYVNGGYFRVGNYYNAKTYESGGYKVDNLTALSTDLQFGDPNWILTAIVISDSPNEEMVSLNWDRAPQGIKHLIALDNNVLVGAREHEIVISVPGFIHAFPADTIHRRAIPSLIKGLAKIQGGFVVLTKKRAHLFLGYSAETIVEVNVDFPYPLGDKRSLVTVDGSAVWVTNEGIAAMGNNGGQILTAGWTERDTWNNYIDWKNCQCEIHEQRLIVFCRRPPVNAPKGYIFDLRLQEIFTFDCSQEALDGLMYRDPDSGEIWYSHSTVGLNRFNRGGYTIAKWRSGRIDVPQGYIPGGCRIQADRSESQVLRFDMGIGNDVDGTRQQNVSNSEPFWCGQPELARWFQYQVESNEPVSSTLIAEDIQDV